MKNLILVFALVLVAGCAYPNKKAEPYLNEYAKQIIFTDNKNNCKVLGEIQSFAQAPGVDWGEFTNYDLYVRNDLRNQASVFAKNGDNIRLRIIDKKVICWRDGKDCTTTIENKTGIRPHITELKYTAEILKCN
ncbi:MAG: hypothetical protein IKR42_07385 [Campylobacter sp.]|nr:hypothetical protein [Campylobacter sp.]